jgi:hypothetical protein
LEDIPRAGMRDVPQIANLRKNQSDMPACPACVDGGQYPRYRTQFLQAIDPFSHVSMPDVHQINNRKFDPFSHAGMQEWVFLADLQFRGDFACRHAKTFFSDVRKLLIISTPFSHAGMREWI